MVVDESINKLYFLLLEKEKNPMEIMNYLSGSKSYRST